MSQDAVESADWWLLAVAALVPLAVAVGLYACDLPLGKPGALNYPYTPFLVLRLTMVPSVLPAAAAVALGVWLIPSRRTISRWIGAVLVGGGCVAVAVWSFVAPPRYLSQHLFNFRSPSADGAFLLESEQVDEVGEYLRAFPDRALTAPEHMRGTRVVSNTPGATLLAVATSRLLHGSPTLHGWMDRLITEEDLTPSQWTMVAEALLFAWALTGLWLLAVPVLYMAARFFLPAQAAAAFAVCCFVSPMTLVFTPGKDPAQLLTVAVPLLLWLWAYRDERRWAALAAGGFFVLSCMVSLVHVWVAVILLIACGLHSRRRSGGMRRFGRQNLLPALAGAVLAAIGLYVLCDYNVLATAWAVTQSQSLAARGPKAMPFVWQTLGIPLFLLFAGPALWSAGLWVTRRRTRDEQSRLGLCLLVASAVVMVTTVGFTNMETPRLWIPFVPLLLFGAALGVPLFRRPGRLGAALLGALVFVQITASALHWSLMDMRETEMRASSPTPRFFD